MAIRNRYIFFFFFVAANIFLKLIHAGYASYSFDEMISVRDTLLDFGHIKHEAEWDNNPPFFYYALWIWHKLLPINEFNSRLLSVIFSSLAIGTSFLFAEKYFNLKTALYTSVMLTFSNFLFFYSLETRAYSLIFFLSVISSMIFFSYLEKSSLLRLFWLSLVNFIIIYSHYIAGIVILAQYVFVLLYHRDLSKRFFSIQTFIIICFVALRFTKKQFYNILGFNKKGDFWLTTSGFEDLIHALSTLFFNKIVAALFVLILCFSLYRYIRSDKEKISEPLMYCLFLGFCSVLFLFALGTLKPLFLDRYIIFCVPFATMFISYQLTKFRNIGLLIFLIIITFTLTGYKGIRESSMDYRAISAIVKKTKGENDLIVINTRDNVGLFEYYYDRDKFMKYKNIDSVCASQNIYGVNSVEALKSVPLVKGNKIFLVQSFHNIGTSDNKVKDHLSTQARLNYFTSFYRGVELSVFKN